MINLTNQREFPNRYIDASIKTEQYSRMHSHNFFELMYILKGSLCQTINTTENIIMREGDFLFLDLGSVHQYEGYDVEVLNLKFLPSAISSNMSDCKKICDLLKHYRFGIKNTSFIPFPIETVLHDENNMVLSTINMIGLEMQNPQMFTKTICRQYLISLLLHILQGQYTEYLPPSKSNLSTQMIELIEENYSQPNLMSFVSSRMNYSPTYLSAVFKADIGITFKKYVQNYKINIAKQLLLTTDDDISVISNSIGYTDPKFFSELFKRYTKMTPSEYRRITKLSEELLVEF